MLIVCVCGVFASVSVPVRGYRVGGEKTCFVGLPPVCERGQQHIIDVFVGIIRERIGTVQEDVSGWVGRWGRVLVARAPRGCGGRSSWGGGVVGKKRSGKER